MLRQIPRAPFTLLVLLSLSFSLWGCSTPGRTYTKSEMHETLETEILPNTSKMFVYRLKWPADAIPNHVRIERGHSVREPRSEGGIEVNRYTAERLQENAAYVVEKTGYCRAGYIELDRSMSRYHLWLKGECKEGATEADMERFGEAKILPISGAI